MSSLYKQTQHKRRVTMFSFPRSGSNWISYCIEQVSGLAVIGSDSHKFKLMILFITYCSTLYEFSIAALQIT